MTTKKIKKILIANRGEISCRIMRTCRELEIATVSLHMAGEEKYPHVLQADESIFLEGSDLRSTYLNKEKIVQLAKEYKVDAIHPGYGMLSERAEFAALVEKSGIIFIGPSSDSIERMGDKIGSKLIAEELKIPLIPGYHGEDQSIERLVSEMKKIGFPLLIKASAGGGGKGMKIVNREEDFLENLSLAKSEALKSFGSDRILLERYIEKPRHIEAQLLCSSEHGQYLHLFERECSIQRRYQKIIEEAPAVNILPETRAKLLKAAINLAEHIHYRGVGTVEFMVEKDAKGKESFFFLEMNTRLQVEHPVTELITGLDLVALQIRIAEGEKIPFKQEDIHAYGHALEARLYAEDPDHDFFPCVGTLGDLGTSSSPYVRTDHGLFSGNEVLTLFDPMLSKVASWGQNREEARIRLLKGLDELIFSGVKNNRSYLQRILAHPSFQSGETYTHFVKTHNVDLSPPKLSDNEKLEALASFLAAKNCEEAGSLLDGFRNV